MEKLIKPIILAAGKGQRMGQPKIYQKINQVYFLNKIVNTFNEANLKNITLVVFPDCDTNKFSVLKNIKWIINPNPEKGMLSSVFYGINDDNEYDGFLIIPVDHPNIQVPTLKLLIKYFNGNSDSIIKPVYQGVKGHPVIFPKSLASKIKNDDLEGGLNTILSLSGYPKINISVNDSGVVENLNIPEDLL